MLNYLMRNNKNRISVLSQILFTFYPLVNSMGLSVNFVSIIPHTLAALPLASPRDFSPLKKDPGTQKQEIPTYVEYGSRNKF